MLSLHPTAPRLPRSASLMPIIEVFLPARRVVLDPPCGSGSTLVE